MKLASKIISRHFMNTTYSPKEAEKAFLAASSIKSLTELFKNWKNTFNNVINIYKYIYIYIFMFIYLFYLY